VAALGRPVPYAFGPRRAGDPLSLVADTRRIQAELGWRPARSDLPTMIADAYRWAEKASSDRPVAS